MIRIYFNDYKYESGNTLTHEDTIIKRIEGGSWFSEETNNGTRNVYKLITRSILSDNTLIEILKGLDDTFIETPCWPHESLESWTLLQKQGLGSLWKVGYQQVISFPIEQLQTLSPWLESLLGPDAYTEIQEELRVNKKVGRLLSRPFQQPLLLSEQPSQDLAHPEKLEQRELIQRAKSVLQTQRPTQSSGEKHHAGPRVAVRPSLLTPPVGRVQQHSSQGLVSVSPRAVQTGSLCQPTLLPELPLPRKSQSHPPKHHKQTLSKSQERQKQSVCLINLSES